MYFCELLLVLIKKVGSLSSLKHGRKKGNGGGHPLGGLSSYLFLICARYSVCVPPPSSRSRRWLLVAAPTTRILVAVRRRARLNTHLPTTPPQPERVLAESSSGGVVDALKRAFVNERCAPDLLPHQDELVNDVKDRINEQARAHESDFPPPFPTHAVCRPRR